MFHGIWEREPRVPKVLIGDLHGLRTSLREVDNGILDNGLPFALETHPKLFSKSWEEYEIRNPSLLRDLASCGDMLAFTLLDVSTGKIPMTALETAIPEEQHVWLLRRTARRSMGKAPTWRFSTSDDDRADRAFVVRCGHTRLNFSA